MKALISPLLLVYVFLALILSVWACSRRREAFGSLSAILILWAAFAISFLLYLPATWVGSEWLRGSLVSKIDEPTRYSDWRPDWIVVLSGGLIHSANPEENILAGESALRVARAVTLAKAYPDAGVIFSGGLGQVSGDKGQASGGLVVQLMRELAVARGVEPQRCRLEFASTNTMEHPQGVLALDGVGRDDRLLVVSSDWHLPRVRMVFDPVFSNIRYEDSSMRLKPAPLWKRLLPNEEALAASALYLREWVGRGWYFLKS